MGDDEMLDMAEVEKNIEFIAREKEKDISRRKEPRGRPPDKPSNIDFEPLIRKCIRDASSNAHAINLFYERGGFNSINTARIYFYRVKSNMNIVGDGYKKLVKKCIEETSTKGEAVELFYKKGNFKSFTSAHNYFYKFKEKRKS